MRIKHVRLSADPQLKFIEEIWNKRLVELRPEFEKSSEKASVDIQHRNAKLCGWVSWILVQVCGK